LKPLNQSIILITCYLDVSLALGDSLPASLALLNSKAYQSLTFEVCGSKHPQLVKYDFEEEMKPIFATTIQGSIIPYALTCALQYLASVPSALTFD